MSLFPPHQGPMFEFPEFKPQLGKNSGKTWNIKLLDVVSVSSSNRIVITVLDLDTDVWQLWVDPPQYVLRQMIEINRRYGFQTDPMPVSLRWVRRFPLGWHLQVSQGVIHETLVR